LTAPKPRRIFDGMAQPNQHVKHHLDKNGVDPSELPDSVIVTLNSLSPQELNAMDKVGDSLEKENVSPNVSIAAMH
jgi:hypothetical protein